MGIVDVSASGPSSATIWGVVPDEASARGKCPHSPISSRVGAAISGSEAAHPELGEFHEMRDSLQARLRQQRRHRLQVLFRIDPNSIELDRLYMDADSIFQKP